MAATITTTAPTITSAGITAPSFDDVLQFLVGQYQSIFGSDVYLGSDSQEGQFLSVVASAINDANSVAIGVYNAFSPVTAQGANLSSVVQINGLTRQVATPSTVDVLITGVAGTTISNGVVGDVNNIQWDLPATVTIPPGGQITVTATCETEGAITALPGTVITIATPTLGWQSVTNQSQSASGVPVETDAALRKRQAASVAIPSLSILEGIAAAVAAVQGVQRLKVYDNDTASTDANGIPAHTISLVVDGGDAQAIATAIGQKKSPGTGTYGNVTETVVDQYGTRSIKFFTPTDVPIGVAINLTALQGYSTLISTEIQKSVSDYINALAIGQDVLLSRLYTLANLSGSADSLTYEITSLKIAGGGLSSGTQDIPIAFNAAATCTPGTVTITVN